MDIKYKNNVSQNIRHTLTSFGVLLGICTVSPYVISPALAAKQVNNNVQIDMSVIQELNTYYDDDKQTQDVQTPTVIYEKTPEEHPRVTGSTNQLAPEGAPVPPSVPDSKIKQINALLDFQPKDLTELLNVPLPLKKPVFEKPEIIAQGETRRTIITKDDIQKNLQKDTSGVHMPAVPSKTVASEEILPSALNEEDRVSALDRIHIKSREQAQNIPASARQTNENTRGAHIIPPVKPEYIGTNSPNKMAEDSITQIEPSAIPQTVRDITANADIKKTPELDAIPAITAGHSMAQTPQQRTEQTTNERIAALPPQNAAPANPNLTTIPYISGESRIEDHVRQTIEQRILSKLMKDDTARLQIRSYASSTDENISNARRISLTRALSIRTYLLSKGIEPQRLDIRALGSQTNQTPLDRVDLLIVPHTSKG